MPIDTSLKWVILVATSGGKRVLRCMSRPIYPSAWKVILRRAHRAVLSGIMLQEEVANRVLPSEEGKSLWPATKSRTRQGSSRLRL